MIGTAWIGRHGYKVDVPVGVAPGDSILVGINEYRVESIAWWLGPDAALEHDDYVLVLLHGAHLVVALA
jgi:hypothetical protein